ncbi:pilus assembly protein TadG-related protein [Phenylobacterium sp. VNQ135]|uniref:pilus assembly protein TadG-related protein n=1 Tax=Phenylobacterium sp. VNQ135 TaxID=3400922 RepID=UPI003C1148FD
MGKMRFFRPRLLDRLIDGFREDRGNVAITVALAMLPISFGTLAAVDLARGASARVQLQDALDAAALAAARSTANDPAVLQATGDRILRQNLSLGADFELLSSSFTFVEGNKVAAQARIQVEPYVAGLIGADEMEIDVDTEVVRAGMKLEIALVLDNTLSMNDNNKIGKLKEAANAFVDKMEEASKGASEANTIKISLVPFSQTVRLDPAVYRNMAWIDQNGSSPINNEIFTTAESVQWANRFTLLDQLEEGWAGCVESRQAPYDIQDTPPTTGATLFTPYFAPDEPDKKADWYFNEFPNSYLSDEVKSDDWRVRQGNLEKYKKKFRTSWSKGPNRGCDMSPIVRLTTNFAALRTAITGMKTTGYTNIPMGLVWGWHTLAPVPPFADGVPYRTDKHKKIVVLMTDGENTIESVDTPNGSSYSGTAHIRQGRVLRPNGAPLVETHDGAERREALDDRLAKLCTNMKAAAKDIEIYTIRVEVVSGSSTVLKTCASSSDHYYDVKDSSQMTMAFQSIAGQIAALHLSR